MKTPLRFRVDPTHALHDTLHCLGDVVLALTPGLNGDEPLSPDEAHGVGQILFAVADLLFT